MTMNCSSLFLAAEPILAYLGPRIPEYHSNNTVTNPFFNDFQSNYSVKLGFDYNPLWDPRFVRHYFSSGEATKRWLELFYLVIAVSFCRLVQFIWSTYCLCRRRKAIIATFTTQENVMRVLAPYCNDSNVASLIIEYAEIPSYKTNHFEHDLIHSRRCASYWHIILILLGSTLVCLPYVAISMVYDHIHYGYNSSVETTYVHLYLEDSYALYAINMHDICMNDSDFDIYDYVFWVKKYKERWHWRNYDRVCYLNKNNLRVRNATWIPCGCCDEGRVSANPRTQCWRHCLSASITLCVCECLAFWLCGCHIEETQGERRDLIELTVKDYKTETQQEYELYPFYYEVCATL
eukprot:66606_1